MSRVPLRRFQTEGFNVFIATMESDVARRNELLDKHGWEGRRVLGYKIPDWQRPLCWTPEQSSAFIESVYLGANIGAFMWNDMLEEDLTYILLDGQQRLNALEQYWKGEIPVKGEDGRDWYWTELEQSEKNRFLRISFPCLLTHYDDIAVMKEAYNRHNFSGTPHLSHEMAAGAQDFREQEVPPILKYGV